MAVIVSGCNRKVYYIFTQLITDTLKLMKTFGKNLNLKKDLILNKVKPLLELNLNICLTVLEIT